MTGSTVSNTILNQRERRERPTQPDRGWCVMFSQMTAIRPQEQIATEEQPVGRIGGPKMIAVRIVNLALVLGLCIGQPLLLGAQGDKSWVGKRVSAETA